jgi:hypothetical protein
MKHKLELHLSLSSGTEMKRAPPSPYNNTLHNATIDMNHKGNDDINEACSALLESPPYNKELHLLYRQYRQTSNEHHYQQQQQQQQQQQTKKPPSSAAVLCTVISPPTPDKPYAHAYSVASTLKHANTTAAAPQSPPTTTQYCTEQHDDINEACSALLESPPYGRKGPHPLYRQYSPPSEDHHYHHQQQQQQQTKKPPSSAAVLCTVISPPTPDKPSAHAYSVASTLKHANTTAGGPQSPPTTTHHHTEQQKKRSVSFASTATVQPINIPRASDMTNQEKQIIWYLEKDYTQFKHDAASDGGVKIIRRASAETQQMKNSCHFVLIGSFDGKCDEDLSSSSYNGSSHSSSAATCGSNRSSPSGKFYNEHEYNDYMKENGQEVCKRGLGYHFSRIRKRHRAMTRSAVVAWQKSIKKESNKQRIERVVQSKMQAMPYSSSNRKPVPKIQETQSIVLAMVSTKCSRVSREEALWRGNIDFRVAYPERCIQRKRSSGSRADDDLFHTSKRHRSNVCAYSSETEGDIATKMSAARYAAV